MVARRVSLGLASLVTGTALVLLPWVWFYDPIGSFINAPVRTLYHLLGGSDSIQTTLLVLATFGGVLVWSAATLTILVTAQRLLAWFRSRP